MALALAAIVTARFGYSEYQTQGRTRRGQWLTDLHKRFTREWSFQAVRRELYNGADSDLAQALAHKDALEENEGLRASAPLTEAERKLIVALDDYLDFLGLIEYLIVASELDEREAYALFSWYALDGLEVPAILNEIEDSFQLVADLRRRFRGIWERDENALAAPASAGVAAEAGEAD